MCTFTQQLRLYLDGELPPDERIALAEHVGSCPSCFVRVAANRERRLQELEACARDAPAATRRRLTRWTAALAGADSW